MARAKREAPLGRRDFFRAVGVGAAVASVAPLGNKAAADSESQDEKRKPRYQASSPDVQAYYRVNRYPTSSAKGG